MSMRQSKLPSRSQSKEKNTNKSGQNKGHYKQLPKGTTYNMTSKTYKSQKCAFYEKGCCRKGDECTYSHDFQVGAIQEICKFYLSGNCHKQNCIFSHDLASYPCKFYHISMNCQKLLECPFNHAKFKNEEEVTKFIRENFDEVYKHIIAGFQTPLNVYAFNKPFFRDMMRDHEVKILETGHRDNNENTIGQDFSLGKHKVRYNELNIGDSYEGIIGGNILGGSVSDSEDEKQMGLDNNQFNSKKEKNDEVTIFNPF